MRTATCPGCLQTIGATMNGSCPVCGFPGPIGDGGVLDLGIIREEELHRNNLDVFYEEIHMNKNFESVTRRGVTVTSDRRRDPVQVVQDLGIALGVTGGLGVLAALNVLLWRWAL